MRAIVRATLIAALLLGLVVAGCGDDDDGGGSGSDSINVAIVDNPQMKDIADLTPELFTKKSGVKVKYTILDEGTLRQVTTRDVAAGGRQFDGKMYAAPFYAESSFLMYRKDVLKEEGVTIPAKPTWDQVAAAARKVDSPDMAGICLRGKPGWGDLGASFTTVLNTFGGTWWSANDDGSVGAAQVDQPEFKEALQFYVDLVNDAGEDDAANASFNECLAQYQDGKVAMWYDATVAAGTLEADDSPVKGLNGYVTAPVRETEASGWLWTWALAIPQNSPDPDTAWEYISWATGPDYVKAAGEQVAGGWAAIPPGTRASTYEISEYQEAAGAFADATLESMEAAPIDNPGTTPRPGLPGVQYVGIPEFQDVGNRCTEQFSSVIAGQTNIDAALSACQDIASQVGG